MLTQPANLRAAIFSDSDYLVTHNIRDFKAVKSRFRFEVVTSGQFIQIMEG